MKSFVGAALVAALAYMISTTLVPPPVGRAPDRVAASWTCPTVMPSVSTSDDAAFVDYAYCLVLGRPPDERGKRTLVGQLARRRVTRVKALLDLFGSTEFALEHKYRDRPLSRIGDAEFVEFAYGHLLERPPTDDERRGAGAKGRRLILQAIIESPEFTRRRPMKGPETGTAAT